MNASTAHGEIHRGVLPQRRRQRRRRPRVARVVALELFVIVHVGPDDRQLLDGRA